MEILARDCFDMHVCLFDIDGTLVNTGGAGLAALQGALRTGFGIGEPTDRVSLAGRTDRGIAREMFEHYAIPATEENWFRFRDAYLAHLHEALPERPGRVLPGVVPLLEQLARNENVLLALLTGNVEAGARLKLGHYGIAHYFPCGGFGDHHPERNDVAREALEAVTKHRHPRPVAVERVWVIGDTPLDVRCARAIGAKVVAVATGTHTLAELEASQPDLALADLTDPSPWFDAW